MNPDVERLMPDPDRRDDALLRLLCAVHRTDAPSEKPREITTVTPTEIRLLQALSVGLQMSEAATVLGVSFESVKTHMKAVRRKLKAKNTTHAIAEALREGLIL